MKITQRKQRFSFPIRHLPIKRLFDLAFSSAVIAVGSPLFLGLAAIVKFSSKGPVIYAHQRVGRGGKPFHCLKFRTMYADADERLKELLRSNPHLKKEWDLTQKLKHDPRITPIGQFLRKTSLDELPQFFNVLKGDLSVVGPRAMVEDEIKRHVGKVHAQKILSIRPGITGLWQTSGRSDTSYPTRIRLDKEYVSKLSLRKDLRLIARTIPVMLFSKGAY